MKILIASDLHWPTINGVATFSRNLARGLADKGHNVLVVAPSQTGKPYKEIDGSYTIIRTASVAFPFYQNFRISLTPYREIKNIINEFNPDVIHIQMLLMIGQAVMKYGNKMNVPIVSTNHAIPENLMDNLKLLAPIARPINYMLKMYGARFHSKADYVTLPTNAAIEMFGSAVEKVSSPIEAVSNGIDLSRFKRGRTSAEIIKKFKLVTDRPIVAYIGRLDAEKHLSVLINAFVRVLDKTKSHLLIVGDGTDTDNLKLLAYQMGVSEQITFTGRVSNDEIVELHKVGTVFCMPSPAELQSIATLEAMASGQPIVAVDAGALSELCQNERNGYLCESDNDEQIADSLIRIISNPVLRKSMSQESVTIAKTHDLKYTIKRFEEIYSSLISTYTTLHSLNKQ